jgi:hypothetical protein
MKTPGFAVVAAFAALSALAAQEVKESKLGIRRIVLYKHGVGYFEREGAVQGTALVPLSFKTAQMKDMLKSLFAIDLSGGRISTIHYDSKDPVSKQLEEILFRVPEGSALTQFLAQLKGARVKVTVGSRATEGNVLGIEPVQTRTEDGVLTRHRLVLLRAAGGIEALDVLDASQIEILDENVVRDLQRMMDIYSRSRYADRKTVNLRAEGQGERRLRVGYIIETPIWKTTYRLLLDEKGGPPLLQGWAIVENRTDEDWDDVNLSFVAGSPMSFVLDLYTSYYPQRPVVSVGQGLAATPGGVPGPAGPATGAPAERALAGRRARAAGEERAKAEGLAPDAAAAPSPSLGELLEASNLPLAQGVAVGDLFSYVASGPVTIKQGQAALVPILLERVGKSERILYWRQDLSSHPSHAVLLDNSTALTLEKGPVTVFEGSTCLGEAMLPKTLKNGMHDVLCYALETAVEVEPRAESHARPVYKATLANGVMTLVHNQVQETTYKLRNKGGKAHAFHLDHSKAGGTYKLVEPKAPHEEFPGHLRFKIDLPATGETVFVVREEQQVSTQVAILNEATDRIRFYLQQTYLSDKTRQFLQGIVGLMEQRANLDRQLAAANEERTRLLQEQETVRRNMGALRDSPQERKLRDEYVERLTRALKRTDELEAQIQSATAQRQDLDRRLAAEVQAFQE